MTLVANKGIEKTKIKLEINENLILHYNTEFWNRVEKILRSKKLFITTRNDLFKTMQPDPKIVYLYPHLVPNPKRYRYNGDIDIVIIDDFDDERIIYYSRDSSITDKVIINRAIFRIVPEESGVVRLNYSTHNIFIPEVHKHHKDILAAIKIALEDLIQEKLYVKYKIYAEVY